MKVKKILIISIIINIVLICLIYNVINRVKFNNTKQILKEMTEIEYEDNITSLNQSHTDYANYIEESKKKIASAITDMGVITSNEETLENMASNIRNISRNKFPKITDFTFNQTDQTYSSFRSSSITFDTTEFDSLTIQINGASSELMCRIDSTNGIAKYIGDDKENIITDLGDSTTLIFYSYYATVNTNEMSIGKLEFK